jgi:phage terminase large subunit GpA-like protein
MSMMSAAVIRREVAASIRPPIRMSVSDAASKYVKVRTSSGGVSNWDRELTPYMVEPMDCLSSREYESVIFAGPAQSGKTQALCDGFVGYMVMCDPSDMMILQTSGDTARDFDIQRLKRLHRYSPEIGGQLAPGSKSNNTFDKIYRSGNVLFLGWPSINKLSGKPLKFMALTDYDRMPEDIDKEGSPYSLAHKRTQTFLSRGMTLVESSPGYEILNPRWTPSTPHEAPPTRGVLSLYNMGDRRRLYWPCPDCGEFFMQPPGIEGFSYAENHDVFGMVDPGILGNVGVPCQICGVIIAESHKRAMISKAVWVPEGCKIENGKVVGTRRKTKIASFWMPGAMAAYQSWRSIVQNYLNALQEYEITGSEQALKTKVNVDMGAPYLPRRLVSDINAADYEKRAEDLPKREVCAGVRFLVAAVDVQKYKFVVQVIGYGVKDESWLIDRFDITQSERKSHDGFLPIDPSGYLEDWFLLEKKVITKRYPMANKLGQEMGILMTACDSGGKDGVTERAYKFWREMKRKGFHKKFILVKGERPKRNSNKPKITLTSPDKTSAAARNAKVTDELPLWLINTTIIKDNIRANLDRIEHGQNYIHFPDWLSNKFYEELTAEIRDEDGWNKTPGASNEAFDLLCYAYAAYLVKLHGHWQKEINWESPPPWAQSWDSNSEVYKIGTSVIDKSHEVKAEPIARQTRFRTKH